MTAHQAGWWGSLYCTSYWPALWACLSKKWHLLVFVLHIGYLCACPKSQLCVQLETSIRNIPGMKMTAQQYLSLSAQMPTSILGTEKEECENTTAKCPPHKKINLGFIWGCWVLSNPIPLQCFPSRKCVSNSCHKSQEESWPAWHLSCGILVLQPPTWSAIKIPSYKTLLAKLVVNLGRKLRELVACSSSCVQQAQQLQVHMLGGFHSQDILF